MFWVSCCLLREGLRVEGPGSVETTAGEEWVGTAERDKSMLKTAGVNQIIAGRTLDACQTGASVAATRMNAQGEQPIITCPAQNSLAAKRVITFCSVYTSFRRLVTVSCASR